MTKEELREVFSLSGSLFAVKLNDNRYDAFDNFTNWAYKDIGGDMVLGEIANYGNNCVEALDNLIKIYNRKNLRLLC